MNLLILLSAIVVVHEAAISKEDECESVLINGIYHDKVVLKTGLDRPYSLAVDFSTNILYFSYSLTESCDLFQGAKMNLYTKEYSDINSVPNALVQAVDQKNHEVYIGNMEGIYKYDYATNKAHNTHVTTSDIFDIYFRDSLYFSDYPSQLLYIVRNGESTRFKDLGNTKIIHFAIDNYNVMFFTNASGLYSQPEGSEDAYLYKELENDEKVRALVNDVKGDVYACFEDGIYRVKTATGTLELVVDVYGAFGLAFDSYNNIVYSNATSVVHLKPNKNNKCQ